MTPVVGSKADMPNPFPRFIPSARQGLVDTAVFSKTSSMRGGLSLRSRKTSTPSLPFLSSPMAHSSTSLVSTVNTDYLFSTLSTVFPKSLAGDNLLVSECGRVRVVS